MTDTRTGACVCGAVTFEADVAERDYLACHCATCRRWSGPAMVVTVSGLRIDDGAPVKTYDSSGYGCRGFCADCGTHLFWKMKDDSIIHLFIGTLESSDDLQFGTQIFIESKPDHYAFANDTKTMTGAEVFAAAMGEI